MGKAKVGLRTALFVEGSVGVPHPRLREAFREIWNTHISSVLGFRGFDLIEPISKKSLIAMHPGTPVSGHEIPLDLRIAKALTDTPFDLAVVAWDLFPRWGGDPKMCRWNETKKLYEGLKNGTQLPRLWKERAEVRYQELSQRQIPSHRPSLQPLAQGEIFALCMEPMFESLLMSCENTIHSILGFGNTKKTVGWPKWRAIETRPDKLLDSAISAARKLNPPPESINRIRGGMDNCKNEWAEYLLSSMIADQNCLPNIHAHPIVERLRELLMRP